MESWRAHQNEIVANSYVNTLIAGSLAQEILKVKMSMIFFEEPTPRKSEVLSSVSVSVSSRMHEILGSMKDPEYDYPLEESEMNRSEVV